MSEKQCVIGADDCTEPKYKVKMVLNNHEGKIAESYIKQDGQDALVCEVCKAEGLNIVDFCSDKSWLQILGEFRKKKQPLPSKQQSKIEFEAV